MFDPHQVCRFFKIIGTAGKSQGIKPLKTKSPGNYTGALTGSY